MHAHAPPVVNLIRGGYNRGLHTFQGGQRHHRRFCAPEDKKEGGGGGGGGGSNRRRASPGDDTDVVSLSPEQLRKMVGVIVVVCTAFGLAVSEAEGAMMCLLTKESRRLPPHSA